MPALTNQSPVALLEDTEEMLSGAEVRSLSLLERIAAGIQQILTQLSLITDDEVHLMDRQDE